MNVTSALRSDLRGAISTAYYIAREEGRTMESAADDAVSRVVDLLETSPPKEKKEQT